MDDQANAVPLTPESPKKSKKWLWLLIGVPVVCICVCVVAAGVAVVMDPTWLNVFDTGAPTTDIRAGKYENDIYTAPNGNFTCNYSGIMTQGWGPVLRAVENAEKGTGAVFTTDDFGRQYGVDYFKISKWGEDGLADDLSDPATRQQVLQVILESILLPTRNSGAVIDHQEFLDGDILFATIINPEASHLVVTQNGVTTTPDYYESYYIFAREEWFYFVYYYITPIDDTQSTSASDMEPDLKEFYEGCEFQP